MNLRGEDNMMLLIYDQKCAEKDLALIEINIGWMVGLKTPINVVANSYMTPPE
jgi:hypothetical protein